MRRLDPKLVDESGVTLVQSIETLPVMIPWKYLLFCT